MEFQQVLAPLPRSNGSGNQLPGGYQRIFHGPRDRARSVPLRDSFRSIARAHAYVEAARSSRSRNHLRERRSWHAAVPTDLYRVLRTSTCRHPSASLPSWRGGLGDELECLLVRDIPRRHSIDS